MADYYTSIALTGVTPTILDASLRCYLEQVDDTGGYFHTDIYSDADCTDLIGHTATYNTTGAKAVTADGGSGLGGTVTVATASATATAVVAHFGRWSVVDAITDALLTIVGRPLNEGTVPYFWYGNPERVVCLPLNLPGSFATATEPDALRDVAKFYGYWRNRRAHLACYRFTAAATHGSNEPRIQAYVGGVATTTKNSSEGWEVSATPGTVVVANDLSPGLGIAEYGSTLELGVTVQSGGSGDDADLTCYEEWVLE